MHDLGMLRPDQRIRLIRGERVMVDWDLAELYGVPPKVLLQAVRRNKVRFPRDFMFQVTRAEYLSLRSQIVTLEGGRGRHRKYLPYVFTEQGVAMLSSVLRSPRAVRVNIEVMRAFVRMRAMLGEHETLARRIDKLERKYDRRFKVVFDAIRSLIEPAPGGRPKIGFKSPQSD
jgi:hypothetical protein